MKEAFRLVKLWTSNLADALYIEPIQPLGLKREGVITLQHALKRAIEAELYFYGRVFDFPLGEPVDPIYIENWGEPV